MHRTLVLIASLAGLFASSAARAQRRPLSVEVNPLHVTVGWAPWGTEHRRVGLEVGFGVPQLEHTLSPEGAGDFLMLAHVGAFVRGAASRRVDWDVAFRAGLADLPTIGGDLPELFSGVTGSVMFGGRRVKVGPRLNVAYVASSTGSEHRTVTSVSPFVVRLTLP